ncbi:hypothetical protein GIB67_014861 [Kingdonia uniflora]|uniref:Uncharacterized protein n=1 Tax=Kingdonia uniflora TaxID=39325 RepID=A0A7J7MTB4_9MAGN|nr:hypothetical protein GIB67_014861 [Kingdonia uniflora]
MEIYAYLFTFSSSIEQKIQVGLYFHLYFNNFLGVLVIDYVTWTLHIPKKICVQTCRTLGHTDTRVDTPINTSCLDHNLFDIAFKKFSSLIHVIQPY